MAVGEIDVDALLARVSSRAITEWMAYFTLEPFGEERADWRMAIIASLIANANRDPQKRKEPFTPQEFLLNFDARSAEEGQVQDLPQQGLPQQKQTWEQKKAIMMALTKQSPQRRGDAES